HPGEGGGRPQPIGRIVIAAAGLILFPLPARAWGRVAPELVPSRAIDTLPKPLKAYDKEHRLEIPSLSLEANPPEEGPERRFQVDRLMPFPFEELPKTEAAFRTRFGDEGTKVGRLP